jgi:WD40 repeat protein
MSRPIALALVAALAGTTFAAPVPPPPPTDRHGDPLPPGVVARFGTVRLRMSDAATLDFTPDSKGIVAVGHYSVKLFDRATGRLVRGIEPGPGYVTASVVAPDGKTAYTLHGRRVVASDLTTGRASVLYDGEIYIAHHAQLAVSADGKVLAVADPDNQATRPENRRKAYVRLIDTATGKSLFYTERYRMDGKALSLSPDGSLFTLGLGSQQGLMTYGLVAYDVKADREAFRLEKVYVPFVAFSPDGRTLAVVGTGRAGGRVEFLDPRTGKVLAQSDEKYTYLPRMRFTTDGSELWAFAPDKPPLALDPAGKKPARVLAAGLPSNWAGYVLSADLKWFMSCSGSVIKVRDTATGREVATAPDNDGWRWAVPSPDGSRVATLGPESLAVWDTKTGRQLVRITGKDFGPDLRWTADGKRVTACQGHHAVWWDAATGKESMRMKVASESPSVVSVRGDRVFVSIWRDEAAPIQSVWDVVTGKEAEWSGPDPLTDHWQDYLSPTGDRHINWAEGRDDRGLRYVLHGTAEGKTYLSYWNEYHQFAFAPDGKTVVGAGPRGVRVWDAATGKVLRPGPPPVPDEPLFRGHVRQVAVAPNGATAVVAIAENVEYRQPGGEVDVIHTGRMLLREYDLATGKLTRSLGGFDALDRVTYLPDGKRLLVVRHGYAEVLDPDKMK